MFRTSSVHLQEALHWRCLVGVACTCRCCTKLTQKTASVVPPEDDRLTPETCRGFKTLESDCEIESVLSWLRYYDSYIMIHGQQNVKFRLIIFMC
jgi:hypothetical protein